MISKTRPSFWRLHARLSDEVKARTKQVYTIFLQDPAHASLRFKKLQTGRNLWSVRISSQYRAVGARQGETIEWIWIGTHNEFDNQF